MLFSQIALAVGGMTLWASVTAITNPTKLPLPEANSLATASAGLEAINSRGLHFVHHTVSDTKAKIRRRAETGPTENAERDAMQALEENTFVGKHMPTQEETFNAWNLHLCEQTCDSNYTADRTKLYGHPTVAGIPFDQITFKMCNYAYIECNKVCQNQYNEDMKSWPLPETDWKTYTSSNLTICINGCNGDAATDNTLLTKFPNKITNMERDGDFAHCFRKLSGCVQKCQNYFNEEVKDFQD